MWASLANNDSWCFLFSSMDDLWKRRDYKVSLCIYPNASFIWWIPLPAYSEDSQYREYSDYSGHSTLSADSAESLVRKKCPENDNQPKGTIWLQIFVCISHFWMSRIYSKYIWTAKRYNLAPYFYMRALHSQLHSRLLTKSVTTVALPSRENSRKGSSYVHFWSTQL